jgi:polyhydroxybutyrate depolymerase
MSFARRWIPLLAAVALAMGCGSTPVLFAPSDAGAPVADGGAAPRDGGPAEDGGAAADDGGAVVPDGGGAGDGGDRGDGGQALEDGGASGGDAGADGASAGDGGGTSSDGGGLADPCAPGSPRPPTDETRTLTWQGRERSFRVHVPTGYQGLPTPLVFNFHGFGSDAWQQEIFSKMTGKADAAGFIVVYPNGTGFPRGWNGGTCCGNTQDVDDVGFVGAMIDDLSRSLCVDPKRVYATGMSNGGFLSHRLACELADRIAAVGPVAGVMGVSPCTPARPISVMHFHGTADTIVPYDGGGLLNFASVADTIAGWVVRNGCTAPAEESFARGDSRCETYRACQAGAEVTLCTVDGGGHTWPGGTPVPTLGHTTQDLIANDAMWEFFAAHPLQ